MKRKYKIVLIFIALLLIAIITLPTLANEIDKAKEEKSGLEERKEQTQKTMEKLEKQKGDLLTYIKSLDDELDNLHQEIDSLNQSIAEIEVYIEITDKELEEAKQKEATQYETMKKRIQFMYENGNNAYLEVLLNSKSLSDLLNKSEYIAKISEYDHNMLERYIKTKELVAENEAKAKQIHQEYLDTAAELDYEQSVVEQLMVEKNTELEKYQESINESEVLLAQYEEDIEAQDKLIAEMIEQERIREEEERIRKEQEAEAKRLAKEAEEKKLKEEEEERIRLANEAEKQRLIEEAKQREEENKKIEEVEKEQEEKEQEVAKETAVDKGFAWPCPGSGRITSYFGAREQPIAGASTTHKGIDIGAPTGTQIVSSAAGTVVISTYSASAGYYIMVSHGNGIFTVYMHCSKLMASVGDTVSKGEVIALVGSTGISTGPHLHYGVMINDVYVNPLNYVSY